MSLKSRLMQHPRLYERIQRVRDGRSMRRSRKAGFFSQHGEDTVILDLLKAAAVLGPYVDIGSNHPFIYSNTFLLYLHGWRGVCVDPLPRFAPLYRRWRPHDVFVCVAVGEVEGEVPLFEFEWDMLSTLDRHLASAYQQAGHRLRRASRVRARPISAILRDAQLSAPLSLLSVDVEGYELSVLRTIDLDRWQPAFVCLEVQTADGSIQTDAIDYLKGNGYRLARDMGLNVILERT